MYYFLFSSHCEAKLGTMSKCSIAEALDQYGTVILDGGLATLLEVRGCNIVDELWSAKTLIENPEKIYQVHYDYFVAGMHCVSTASYQATPQGFAKRGLDETESVSLIKLSATLAQKARNDYRAKNNITMPLLVAGSVGPYGAYLADGSEYTGNYDLPEQEMIAFHRLRVQTLIEADVDLLAFETIPSFAEAKALLKLLAEFSTSSAWFSFTLLDEEHISDGTKLSEVTAYLNNYSQVAAIGVNCVAPELVTQAIQTMKRSTNKPIVVYPNKGEKYDAVTKTWQLSPSSIQYQDTFKEWLQTGASLIGGCCRTTPEDIEFVVQYCQAKQ